MECYINTMLKDFIMVQLPAGSKLNMLGTGDVFILETCQRTLALGINKDSLPLVKRPLKDFQVLTGDRAYRHLLEVHCGLKSRMIGEHEIVSQFKKAYSNFLQRPKCNTRLMGLLEKLFKDGKEVRHKHLLQIGQQSYAGIARRLLSEKAKRQKILIAGTGNMAKDLIKVMNKHFNIVLTGRNHSELSFLCNQKKLDHLAWPGENAFHSKKIFLFAHIVNTVGTEDILYPPSFFKEWEKNHGKLKTFIDLGKPSPIKTNLSKKDHVYRLQDIFDQGIMLDQIKQEKIDRAQELIHHLVAKKNV